MTIKYGRKFWPEILIAIIITIIFTGINAYEKRNGEQEIKPRMYFVVTDMLTVQPELKNILPEMFKDNKITNKEFRILESEYQKRHHTKSLEQVGAIKKRIFN